MARPIHAGPAKFVFTLAVSLALSTSCARKTSAHVPPSVKPARIGEAQTGIASWYGVPYNGRRSANGEIYDMEKLTAAHRTFPFDTWVEVTNLSNNKRVDVRITDRGPFVNGRIIDLSLAAAREIDLISAGIVRVRIKVIRQPKHI
jgi:rare lipoprotein A